MTTERAIHGSPTGNESSPDPEIDSSGNRIVHLPEVVDHLKNLGPELSQTERTFQLVTDNPDIHAVVSAYPPGRGEELHFHPTNNLLQILHGAFNVWFVNDEGEEEQHYCPEGSHIALDRRQLHRVQADPEFKENSVIMVTIIEAKPTSDPDYSTPWPAN